MKRKPGALTAEWLESRDASNCTVAPGKTLSTFRLGRCGAWRYFTREQKHEWNDQQNPKYFPNRSIGSRNRGGSAAARTIGYSRRTAFVAIAALHAMALCAIAIAWRTASKTVWAGLVLRK